MDPLQATCYAHAQIELQELFRHLSAYGRVTEKELKNGLLPFTAGDVKRDLQELLHDMKQKHTSLDEQEFVRVLWKKMYLSHVMYAIKARKPTDENDAALVDTVWANIPLSHVIVSIKRRSQMKQFAHYYASRGISGADHLTGDANGNKKSPSPTRGYSPMLRKALMVRSPQGHASTIAALRQPSRGTTHEVLALVFDGATRTMGLQRLFAGLKGPTALQSGSPYYCILFAKGVGNHAFGCSFFLRQLHQQWQTQENRRRSKNDEQDEVERPSGRRSSFAIAASPAELEDTVVFAKKLDDVGLRNISIAAISEQTFTACTERRIHQWTLDPLPEPNDGEQMEIHPHAEGDCFGFVGGNKLVECPKTIFDCTGAKEIGSGNDFSIILASSGDLYAWGTNVLIAKGATTPTEIPRSSFLSHDHRIVRIACGAHHALLVTDAGQVFAFGSNVSGQLGLGQLTGEYGTHAPTLVSLPTKQPAIDIACGSDHSIVLTASGHVYAFGNNWQGQLGLDPYTMDATGCLYEPKHVNQLNERMYLIAANRETSAAVSETGRVYTWGMCIPSGQASVCGLVSRWQAQRLEIPSLAKSQPASPESKPDKVKDYAPRFSGMAISNGLVLLSRQMNDT